MKTGNTWSIRYKNPSFRDMKEGRDYVFTDASEQGVVVDIQMMTYNHASYICQAIESVLSQKTQYKYRLIIADDCSTDGTTDIIQTYQQRYPDRIATLIWKHNVGAQCNSVAVSRYSTSAYAATLEGDDYWIDDRKLEKALSYLETHPDYVAFGHNIKLVDEDGKLINSYDPAQILFAAKEEYIYPADNLNNFHLIRTVFLSQTSGIVNRNYQAAWSEDDWDALNECTQCGDRLRLLCLTNEGKSYFSREIMSAYRRVRGTSFTAMDVEEDAKYDGMNVYEWYCRNKSMADFSRKVYNKELLCFDRMAEEACKDVTLYLFMRFDLRNLEAFMRVYWMELKRKWAKNVVGKENGR